MGTLTAFWQQYTAQINSLGFNLLSALAVVIVCYIIAGLARRAIYKSGHRFAKLDDTLIPVLSTVAAYAIYAVGVVIVLDLFGVNTTSLIALMGAAGLAIGLALKDTLSNIAAGIMLLILRPFRVKDFIECGSIIGTVSEVGLFTTQLETPDGLFISAPNSTLWGAPIKNFTRNGKRRMDILVGIAYGDSIDDGLAVLRDIAGSESRLLTAPAPQVMVAAMADSAVTLQLRAWTSTDDYWLTLWDLNKRVKEQIEAAGLTIPFPQRQIQWVDSAADSPRSSQPTRQP
tara:strand:+ start:16814 stop:17674 length:861 start_codon:yes stop_codon:yes gene_type:complete